MKTLVQYLFFVTVLTLSTACQNKKQNMDSIMEKKLPQFEWEENLNCPPGYPVEVYRGGLEGNAAYASLSNGTSTGLRGWGCSGSGSSYGKKALPNRINCIWVSYAERCLYNIDSAIDYDKLEQLFEEGYQDSSFFFNGNGEYKKTTFDTIIVGFAPGGVCVIWAMGAGRQVEIGRYKGEKYVVPQEEIAKLDNHESLLFSHAEYERIMNNTQIVPLAIRQANAGKPIPYGLWDTYRTRYSWRPVSVIKEDGGIVRGVGIECFNGENENLFDEDLIENKYIKRGIPKSLGFSWKDKKGQRYGGSVDFDEEEIFKVFNEFYKDNSEGEAELEFTINKNNDFVTVLFKKDGKDIRLRRTKVTTYKSSLK
ncbi:DUF2931 family protein [uncultured Flavobacterium sp.]|uniref:DUF2931 family protein n=1 Tax=uncultured Flavobacterium sp. TaxID=165435 RepID=UPI00292ECC70|nr:DUF2931 family protein [uncultured Flavobacterium sp.]